MSGVAFSESDGLEVQSNSLGRFQVFDTHTEEFVGSMRRTQEACVLVLGMLRDKYRPIIVRWILGLPIEESLKLGIDA